MAERSAYCPTNAAAVLTNAVGAGRMRQAARGAVIAYIHGGERRVGRRVRAAGMESGHRFFQQRDRPRRCLVC